MLLNVAFISIPTIIVIILVFETAFRFLPTCSTPRQVFEQDFNFWRFDPNGQKHGIFSKGPLFRNPADWRINNEGWNSDIDYARSGRFKPLIAVIGDSYIEGLNINPDTNVVSKLRTKMPEFDIYGFGISGASLSTYLGMSRYVSKIFDPSILVVTLVHNDLDESLCIKPGRRGLCIGFKDGLAPVEGMDYPFDYKKFYNWSALLRYLRFNLLGNIPWVNLYNDFQQTFLGDKTAPKQYEANVDSASVIAVRKQIDVAVNYIIERFLIENQGKRLLFCMDAPRQSIYEHNLERSSVYWMNKMMKKVCGEKEVDFLDLTDCFQKAFDHSNKKFESAYDWHWNEHGHEQAAKCISEKIVELDSRKTWKTPHEAAQFEKQR